MISTVTYKKITSETLLRVGSTSYNTIGAIQYEGGFRNDGNKKAFICLPFSSNEVLWYDFNLSVGDTIPFNKWYSVQKYNYGPNDTAYITKVDSIAYCGTFYKRFKIKDSKGNFPYLIQQIGFAGDLMNLNWAYFEFLARVESFASDTSLYDCSVDITSAREIKSELNGIHVFPNPTSGLIQIEAQNSYFDEIAIRDIAGNVIKKFNSIKSINPVTLNVHLPNGIYLIEFKGPAGSAVQRLFVTN